MKLQKFRDTGDRKTIFVKAETVAEAKTILTCEWDLTTPEEWATVVYLGDIDLDEENLIIYT